MRPFIDSEPHLPYNSEPRLNKRLKTASPQWSRTASLQRQVTFQGPHFEGRIPSQTEHRVRNARELRLCSKRELRLHFDIRVSSMNESRVITSDEVRISEATRLLRPQDLYLVSASANSSTVR